MSELLISWPSLTIGTLMRRYKRFMVDVQLDSGEIITAHCPNSGSMKGCLDKGAKVFLTTSSNPKRKLSKTWELIEMPSSIVMVNTLITNRIVKKAILSGLIPELSSYSKYAHKYPMARTPGSTCSLKGATASPAM